MSQLVSGLRQTTLFRVLILEGSSTETSQLANAIASQLGRPIYNGTAGQDGISAAEEAVKSLSPADQKNSILFFDEADSLFGERTSVKDVHDRYANLEASFAGMIILGVEKIADLPLPVVQRSRTLIVDHYISRAGVEFPK